MGAVCSVSDHVATDMVMLLSCAVDCEHGDVTGYCGAMAGVRGGHHDQGMGCSGPATMLEHIYEEIVTEVKVETRVGVVTEVMGETGESVVTEETITELRTEVHQESALYVTQVWDTPGYSHLDFNPPINSPQAIYEQVTLADTKVSHMIVSVVTC